MDMNRRELLVGVGKFIILSGSARAALNGYT